MQNYFALFRAFEVFVGGLFLFFFKIFIFIYNTHTCHVCDISRKCCLICTHENVQMKRHSYLLNSPSSVPFILFFFSRRKKDTLRKAALRTAAKIASDSRANPARRHRNTKCESQHRHFSCGTRTTGIPYFSPHPLQLPRNALAENTYVLLSRRRYKYSLLISSVARGGRRRLSWEDLHRLLTSIGLKYFHRVFALRIAARFSTLFRRLPLPCLILRERPDVSRFYAPRISPPLLYFLALFYGLYGARIYLFYTCV